MITLECSIIWLGSSINGALVSFSSRYIKCHELMSAIFFYRNIICLHQIEINSRTIVYIVPKILFILFYLFICQAIKKELSVFFHYTKNDCASIRICKCRISIPKISGKTTCRAFEFQVICFFTLEQRLYIILQFFFISGLYHKLIF